MSKAPKSRISIPIQIQYQGGGPMKDQKRCNNLSWSIRLFPWARRSFWACCKEKKKSITVSLSWILTKHELQLLFNLCHTQYLLYLLLASLFLLGVRKGVILVLVLNDALIWINRMKIGMYEKWKEQSKQRK